MNKTSAFISVAEIQKVLEVSESKAYRILRSLNSELKKEGFLVLPGKVSRQYFNERFGAFLRALFLRGAWHQAAL